MNRLLFCVASLGISFLNVPVFGKLTTPVIFSPANNTINAPTGMQLEVESQSVVKYAFEYSESSTMKNAVRVEVARDNYYTRTWLNKLKLSTTYYWRVKSITAKDSSDWTATYNFKTTSIIQRYAPAKNFVKNSASYANVSCYRVAGIDTFEFQFDTTSRFKIPIAHFEAFLHSMNMDLTVRQYQTYEDLHEYVYGSAAVIGLQMVSVLGTISPDAVTSANEAAEKLGIAFQLANFIRDVGEDLDRGRVYLPMTELEAHGVNRQMLEARVTTPQIKNALKEQIQRVRRLQNESTAGIKLLTPGARQCIQAASQLYCGIVDEVEKIDYQIFTTRAKTSNWRRTKVALPAYLRALVSR